MRRARMNAQLAGPLGGPVGGPMHRGGRRRRGNRLLKGVFFLAVIGLIGYLIYKFVL